MTVRKKILSSVSRHLLRKKVERRRKLKELDNNIRHVMPGMIAALNDLGAHDEHAAAAQGLLNILDMKPELAPRFIEALTPEALAHKDFSALLLTRLRKLAEPSYEAKMLPYHVARLNAEMSGAAAAALTNFIEKRIRMDHKEVLATHLVLKIDARVLGHHGGDLVSRLNGYLAAMSPDAYARKVMAFYVRNYRGLGVRYVEPILKSLLLLSPQVGGEMRRMMNLHRITPTKDMLDKIGEATRGMERSWAGPEIVLRRGHQVVA